MAEAIQEQDKARFTPGPWEAVFGTGSKRDYSIFGSDGRELVESVQTHKADGVSAEQVQADANLMATAPDLYEAARLLEEAELANANCPDCDGDGIPECCETCFPLFDEARLKRRAALEKAGYPVYQAEGRDA